MVVGTDWPQYMAPAVHNLLSRIQVGDIVYAKTFFPNIQELRIKAVGIVTDARARVRPNIGRSVGVRWVRKSIEDPERIPKDGDPTFTAKGHSLFEETHPAIAARVVALLLGAVGDN